MKNNLPRNENHVITTSTFSLPIVQMKEISEMIQNGEFISFIGEF